MLTQRPSQRLDKWLWAARLFKTRALAADACELGRIESNEQRAKPARDVRPGDNLVIRTEAGEFRVEVLALSPTRGPAEKAQTLYREAPESRESRLQLAAERREMLKLGVITEGKPNKRDRQERARLRGKIHRF